MSSTALPRAGVDGFRMAVEGLAADGDGERRQLAIDGVTPDVIVGPQDEGDVARVLREASEASVGVIAVGGGRHLGLGNVPEAYDVALLTAGLGRLVAHEPADLTVTMQAGMPWEKLQALLAECGQFLPLDPPGEEGATVGGVVAANAQGPLRHAYGTARDWLIGMRVAMADGTVVKSGGRVVKNVTGYDLHKLHIGALGTLGVVTEVTFKVAPLPRVEAAAVAALGSAQSAVACVRRAHDAGLAITAAEVLSPIAAHRITGGDGWVVLVRLGGGKSAVERSLRDVQAFAHDAGGLFEARDGTEVWARWHAAFVPGDVSLRISVAPSEAGDLLEILDRRFTGASPVLSATVTAGLIRARVTPGTIRAATLIEHAREAAGRRGGFVIVDAAPLEAKRDIDVFGEPRADFAVMRRIKEQYDPRRILSRGRFVGRL